MGKGNVMDLQLIADDIVSALEPRLGEGKVADYIPELARVDPKQFGIAITTVDGQTYKAGHADTAFSIQSISKVFMLTLALGKAGESIWKRVGREPSGSSFNSIVQLEHEHGIPRNPFINAGAIVITDMVLAGHAPREAIGEYLRFMRYLADDETLSIDEKVAQSEQRTGYRNFALANFMRGFGNLEHPVEHTLGVYFHQCALALSCVQLSQARHDQDPVHDGRGNRPRRRQGGSRKARRALCLHARRLDGRRDRKRDLLRRWRCH